VNERRTGNVNSIFFNSYFRLFVFSLTLMACGTGCATSRPVVPEQIDYVKPPTVETAQYAINERITSLERQLRESREETSTVRGTIADCRSEIRGIRESCEATLMVGRRSGDLIQETIEQAEALDRWVNWAYSRLQYLESLLAVQIRD
jgi:septal ring factor EnvC (AmiA/AmiB activator)